MNTKCQNIIILFKGHPNRIPRGQLVGHWGLLGYKSSRHAHPFTPTSRLGFFSHTHNMWKTP